MRELPKAGRRGVHDRVDPDYAPTVEVFDNLTHEQIHSGVSTLNPSVLQSGGQAWRGAAGGLGDAVTEAHTEISGAIADGWRGSAAGPAAAAVRDFEAAGRQLADVLATVGQRLAQAGDAAETLRTAIGEPVGAAPDLTDALLDPHAATGNIAAQRTIDDARADAVRVMESVYSGAFIPTGAGVPAFPDLPGEPGAPAIAPATPPGSPRVAAAEVPVGPTVSFAAPATAGDPATPSAPAEPQPPTAPAAQTPAESAAPAPAPAPADATPAAGPVEAPSRTAAAATTAPSVPAPAAPATPPAAVPAPVAPATAPAVPVFSAPVRPAGSQSGDDRNREEQQRDSSGSAVTGMGAGAIGGMLGGAMAADTVRTGSTVAAPRSERPEPDADDELHWIDDDLTFLEPGQESGELIGALDPTTPPVLGEWSEAE